MSNLTGQENLLVQLPLLKTFWHLAHLWNLHGVC